MRRLYCTKCGCKRQEKFFFIVYYHLLKKRANHCYTCFMSSIKDNPGLSSSVDNKIFSIEQIGKKSPFE